MSLFHRPLPRTLEAALRDLDETNASVRRSAIRDLRPHAAQQKSPAITHALIKALRDKDPAVRTEAAYIAGDMAIADCLPALLIAVDDPHSGVRQAAIDALGQLGDGRATGRLTRALRDERADVRFQAVIALARVSPESGLEAVLRACHDEDAHVRYIALRVAEEMCSDDDLTSEGHVELHEELAKAVREALNDEDAHVRLAAAILLGRAGEPAGAQVLIDVLEDRLQRVEPEDESAAVSLAGSLKLHEAIPALQRRAFGLRRFARERYAWLATVSLALLGDERARGRITSDLNAWSRNRRTMAVVAAGKAKILEARESIERMQGNERMADQDAVQEALQALDKAMA